MTTINWRELMTTDQDKALSFYTELFNWKINTFDMPQGPYNVVESDGLGIGGIMSHDQPFSAWLNYVSVDDADATVEKAKTNGGTLVAGPFDIPKVGRSAILQDPEGATFAVIAYADGVPPQPLDENKRPAVHSFCWSQLNVDDIQKAADFYTATIGWTATPMMPGDDSQLVFKSGDDMVGSIMKNPNPQAPSNWLNYVAVANIDESAKRAGDLGANTIVPKMEIPNMGKFTVHADPTGGVFALWENAH